MKPENLNSFNTLSNLVAKDSNLIVQSTRMDFETNTYISELWRMSKGNWRKFKSGNNNFSNPKFAKKTNDIFYVKQIGLLRIRVSLKKHPQLLKYSQEGL